MKLRNIFVVTAVLLAGCTEPATITNEIKPVEKPIEKPVNINVSYDNCNVTILSGGASSERGKGTVSIIDHSFSAFVNGDKFEHESGAMDFMGDGNFASGKGNIIYIMNPSKRTFSVSSEKTKNSLVWVCEGGK